MFRVRDVLNTTTCAGAIISFVSVSKYLSIYYIIVFFALFLFASYLDTKRVTSISRWILNCLSIAVVILSISRISADFLVEPILDAVLILVGIKLIEEKKPRDYMQIYAMCLFMLMGSGLISFDSIFIVYLSTLLFLLTVSLVLLAYFSHDPKITVSGTALRKIFLSSLVVCTLSVPPTAFFFLILPRTNFPLLNFLSAEKHAQTGFSEDITLGGVSAIQQSQDVIFRAEMGELDAARLYWRGIVLDQFDGITWKSSKEAVQVHTPQYGSARGVEQTIYLEPYGRRYLFALDKPIRMQQNHLEHLSGLAYSLNVDITKTIRYRAVSVPSELLPEAVVDRARFLEIPQDFSPRIWSLSRKLTSGKEKAQQIESLYQYLKLGDFTYSLTGLPASSNALEEFLFQYKRGSCEYFASALAIMLRMAGIPSRLVGGYKGGYYNAAGKYYMVLQRNAHVWVEAYVDNLGWMRLDPTPPMPESGLSLIENKLYLKAKLFLDTFNYYWNKFVISYDFSQQIALLDKARSHFKAPKIRLQVGRAEAIRYAFYAGLLAATALLTYWALYLRRSRTDALAGKFLAKMARYGYRKRKAEGLEELVSRVSDEELRTRAQRFVMHFESIFYKDEEFTREDIKALEEHIANL